MRHARLGGPAPTISSYRLSVKGVLEVKLAAKGVAFYAGDAGFLGPGP